MNYRYQYQQYSFYKKADKESSTKEESKSLGSEKDQICGRQRSESKSASDLFGESKKKKRYNPHLKDLMTNYVMEAGAFDPFNTKSQEKILSQNNEPEGNDNKHKSHEKSKGVKNKKQKQTNGSLSHVDDFGESQNKSADDDEEDFFETRKRSQTFNSAIEVMNSGGSLPSSSSSSSSSGSSSPSSSPGCSSPLSSDEDIKDNKNNDSESSSDDSSDDDDEDNIRLKESQQQQNNNEIEFYENEFFNSDNNWGRRKKLNLSQISESVDGNFQVNMDYFNEGSCLSMKQIKTNVMIIGESKIGKTELISEVFPDHQFPQKLNANYSLDLMIHKLTKNDLEYKINLWIQNLSNTKYEWIIEQVYYKIVSTFIFLYNDSDQKSLESVKNTYLKAKAQSPFAKYVLIGIHNSNSSESKKIHENAKQFTEENNFSHYFDRSSSQSIDESNLSALKHYICPLLFDKDNDSFKCSDFQICQNSTQDSPKSIEFSLNKNNSQDYYFTKQIVTFSPQNNIINYKSTNISSFNNDAAKNDVVKERLMKDDLQNGLFSSIQRRSFQTQKQDTSFNNDQDKTDNSIKIGGLGFYLDSEDQSQFSSFSQQLSSPQKVFQPFPSIQVDINQQKDNLSQNIQDQQKVMENNVNKDSQDQQQKTQKQQNINSTNQSNIQISDQIYSEIPISQQG